MADQVWLWWSSGKDSAWALHELRRAGHRVTRLVTTVGRDAQRVAMHAVRRELLTRQARSAGVALRVVELPQPCSNPAYEDAVAPVLREAEAAGAAMAFGDLFLEDVRAYRLRLLAGHAVEPLFPLWGRDTRRLASQMLDAGLSAIVTCVDPRVLDRRFAGALFDERFLRDLPPGADPCGENGEFHSFAFRGPMFSEPIDVRTGEVVERDGFVFADVLPASAAAEEP